VSPPHLRIETGAFSETLFLWRSLGYWTADKGPKPRIKHIESQFTGTKVNGVGEEMSVHSEKHLEHVKMMSHLVEYTLMNVCRRLLVHMG
jgi:hypothetical protein